MKKIYLSVVFTTISGLLLAQLPVSTTPENKNVVLEEYTGIYCTYCPDGHKIAQNLQSANPNDVFVINNHTGSYASPGSGDPDFRTQWGSALASQAKLSGYPSGSVNRRTFSAYSSMGGSAMSRGSWSSAASTIIGESSCVNVAAQSSIDVELRIRFFILCKGGLELEFIQVGCLVVSLGVISLLGLFNIILAQAPREKK